MTPEKTNELVTKYPKLYSAHFWFECADGWYDLINDLSNQIQTYIDQSGIEQVTASQVKEKFGGLRFYIYGGDDHIYELVKQAEGKSYTICEGCGVPGTRRSRRGWITCSCDDCWSIQEQKLQE